MKIRNKKLNVAILIRNFDRNGGGAEKYCVELTQLISRIHNVHVICQCMETKLPNIKYHLTSKKISSRFLNLLLFSIQANKILKKLNFDIIHSHDIIKGADIYTIHVPCFKTTFTHLYGLKRFSKLIGALFSPRILTYLYMERNVFLSAKKIISVSNLLSENIVQNYPFVKNIDIIHPGISETHENVKIHKKVFKILFIGNSFKRKGLQFLIDSVEIIDDPCIEILVAGNGDPNEVNFKSKMVHKNTTFLGKVKDIKPLYLRSDVLVHPTNGDTFGMVVLEAMSYSLPVIVSNQNYCGISSELTSKNALILKDHSNPKELSDNISKIRNDEKIRRSLSTNALLFAKKMSWDKAKKATLYAYESLITKSHN